MKIPSRSKAKEGYIGFLRNVELDEIHLSKALAVFDEKRFKSSPDEIPIRGRTKCTEPTISGKFFAVSASMEVLMGAPTSKEPICRIAVTYDLKFAVRGRDANPEHIKQFTRSTIKIVIWPFFREFVHNMTTRFGIPAVNIPIHTE